MKSVLYEWVYETRFSDSCGLPVRCLWVDVAWFLVVVCVRLWGTWLISA